MTQEDKELLITDLCSRLPYGVKIQTPADCWTSEEEIRELKEIFKGDDGLFRIGGVGALIEYSKPYLFPLSSMTEEKKEEFDRLYTYDALIINPQWELIDWLNKNHFDYRGLIEKELALDASHLNIYNNDTER